MRVQGWELSHPDIADEESEMAKRAGWGLWLPVLSSDRQLPDLPISQEQPYKYSLTRSFPTFKW